MLTIRQEFRTYSLLPRINFNRPPPPTHTPTALETLMAFSGLQLPQHLQHYRDNILSVGIFSHLFHYRQNVLSAISTPNDLMTRDVCFRGELLLMFACSLSIIHVRILMVSVSVSEV